jgi:hypothetical protein
VHTREGDYAGAEHLFHESLEPGKIHLGEEYPDTLEVTLIYILDTDASRKIFMIIDIFTM